MHVFSLKTIFNLKLSKLFYNSHLIIHTFMVLKNIECYQFPVGSGHFKLILLLVPIFWVWILVYTGYRLNSGSKPYTSDMLLTVRVRIESERYITDVYRYGSVLSTSMLSIRRQKPIHEDIAIIKLSIYKFFLREDGRGGGHDRGVRRCNGDG